VWDAGTCVIKTKKIIYDMRNVEPTQRQTNMDSPPRGRTLGIGFGICLAVVCLCLAGTGTVAAQSADIIVASDGTEDYTSIQNAINNANTGDRIRISQGTYSESIDIRKNVDIVAPDGATISPSSNAVSAVALAGGTESHLVNLTIEGESSIGLDARSSTGDWTAENIHITGFRFGVTTLESTGDWVISDSEIKNSNARGIATERSSGNWTIKSSSIRNVSGIGIDAHDVDAGLIKDTVIEDITQSYEYDGQGINIDDTSGDWVIENVTVRDTGYDGIDAGDTNATHDPVIRNTKVIGAAEEGIDIAGSESDVLITGSTVRDTGPGEYNNAIRIEDAQGDWIIQDTVIQNISGEGIDGYTQPKSSHATIRNLTINGTQNVGINMYESDGDWTIADSVIENTSNHGINAKRSNGELDIDNLTVRNSDSDGIDASNATGNATVHASEFRNMGDKSIDLIDSEGKWKIHESILIGASEGAVEVQNANFRTNASYNYWGTSDGPSGDFDGSGGSVVGDVTVTPYYVDSSLTTLSSEQDTGGKDTPTDPTQRALQITGKSDPSKLTQNDVTAVITRFNRGQSVNNISINQDDVTATITLFGRN
jgi:hypothetical protein